MRKLVITIFVLVLGSLLALSMPACGCGEGGCDGNPDAAAK